MSSRSFFRLAAILAALPLLATVSTACSAEPPEAPAVQQPVETVAALPTILAVTADHQVARLGQTQVECDASAPGGDNLTYKWTATGGTIDGTSSSVTWTAPEKGGDYDIMVVVSDTKGSSATGNVIINVPEKPNNPPVISTLSFARQGRLPIIIKLSDVQNNKVPELVIKRFETAVITCQASDPDNDPVSYAWMATGGKITGNGATVQWIAAGEAGNYTISVDVSDDKGATTTFTIPVTVKCCGV